MMALSLPLSAQLKPGGFGMSSGPVAISADHLKADEAGGLVTFTGAVVARQGEMTLTCDIMKVFYSTGPEDEAAKPKAAPSSPPAAEAAGAASEPLVATPGLPPAAEAAGAASEPLVATPELPPAAEAASEPKVATPGLPPAAGAADAASEPLVATAELPPAAEAAGAASEPLVATPELPPAAEAASEPKVATAELPPAAEAASEPKVATPPKETTSPFDNSARQVERIECNGNVKVVEGDRMAVGETAVYMASSLPRRIILTGDARVWQGRDSLTGHQVTYLLDQKISTVDGNRRSRVQTIFHQQSPK